MTSPLHFDPAGHTTAASLHPSTTYLNGGRGIRRAANIKQPKQYFLLLYKKTNYFPKIYPNLYKNQNIFIVIPHISLSPPSVSSNSHRGS